MAYKTTYGGAVYLTFNNEQIMLTASDLKVPRFTYVAESFYTAISLGKINDAIGAINKKFSDATGISTESITKEIKKLDNIPVLGTILDSELVITEFAIEPPTTKDAKDGRYAFGFGLRLDESKGKLGPIKLDGIAFNISLTQIS